MIRVRFDSGDPRIVYGNPNVRWGSPSVLLEPGDPDYVQLEPGQPGYQPPAPAEPASKPKRRKPSPQTRQPSTNTIAPAPMSTATFPITTFPYVVQPTPNGERFMPRAQYRGTKTTDEILAEVTARLGSDTLTPALAIQLFLETVIDFTKAGWKVEPIFDLLGFRVTIGGSNDSSGFAGTFDGLQVSPNCNFGDTGDLRARDGFSGEKVAEQPRVAAVFLAVTDTFTGDNDHYTPDKNLEIELANRRFKFDPTNPLHWVKFKKDDGTLVAASEYYVAGSKIIARVPTPLTGSVELHLSCEINGSVRMSIYQHMLLA